MSVDPVIRVAARTLGATPLQEAAAVVREARHGTMAGIIAAFGRVMAEVGAILIVGGNTRLLPLTGVTLPFVSYGGSSLLISLIGLLILLIISNHMDEEPMPVETPTPYLALNGILLLGLFASSLATGWWAIIRGPDLLLRNDNLRRVVEERYVPRGTLFDRSNSPITITSGETGSLARDYIYPDLAPIVGYNEPTYGQAGLETTLDGYLRGLEGNPASTIWLSHLLYGTSPHGLDVRIGLGLLGLITVQLLRANGCRVLGSDFLIDRLDLAGGFGAEVVDLSSGGDLIKAAEAFTGGQCLDAVLITADTNSNEPVQQAAKISRKRGRIVLVGVTGLQLNRADFYEKELTFQVSCSYGPGRYDHQSEHKGQDYPFGFVRWTEQRNFGAVLDLVAQGKLDVKPMITERIPFLSAAKVYEGLKTSQSVGTILRSRSALAHLHPRRSRDGTTARLRVRRVRRAPPGRGGHQPAQQPAVQGPTALGQRSARARGSSGGRHGLPAADGLATRWTAPGRLDAAPPWRRG